MIELQKLVAGGYAKAEGGGYEGREGLELRRVGNEVVITGWYDGGCAMEIELRLTIPELMDAAAIRNGGGE
jgi:formate-dependent phosphoribosylglycinamide formyltransferase (GAR transformylase)